MACMGSKKSITLHSVSVSAAQDENAFRLSFRSTRWERYTCKHGRTGNCLEVVPSGPSKNNFRLSIQHQGHCDLQSAGKVYQSAKRKEIFTTDGGIESEGRCTKTERCPYLNTCFLYLWHVLHLSSVWSQSFIDFPPRHDRPGTMCALSRQCRPSSQDDPAGCFYVPRGGLSLEKGGQLTYSHLIFSLLFIHLPWPFH